jgi:hypothetical protein
MVLRRFAALVAVWACFQISPKRTLPCSFWQQTAGSRFLALDGRKCCKLLKGLAPKTIGKLKFEAVLAIVSDIHERDLPKRR